MGTDRHRRPAAHAGPAPVRLSSAALALALTAAWACTEDPLTGPGPDEGDRGAAQTVELSLAPAEMESWRDTTLTGFALPSDADFLVLADREDFRSRGLVRYPEFPDSVEIDEETLEVEAFEDGRVRFVPDTALSAVPSGLTLRLLTLARGFDPAEADWEQAAEGEPWESPGGDFDREVGRLELEGIGDGELPDTIDVPLGAATDSLLTAWRASNGAPGMAALVEADGGQLHMSSAVLQFDVRPADRDTTVTFQAGASLAAVPSTIVFDPATPPTGTGLRVGGLPAARFYVAFSPPVEVDGTRLTGGTINRAEIVFPPVADPPAPFALPGPAAGSGVRLAADPFELGPRTPVGDTLTPGTVLLEPDSLEAGRPLRFEFTDVLRRWASDPDSAGDLRVGVRLRPDAQTVGFWEFGSEASPAAIRPSLRVVVTPPSDFDVP